MIARFGVLAFLPLILLVPVAVEGAPKCTCPETGGCYHWLNAPFAPPNDPCPCPMCREAKGKCPKSLPKGWDNTCAGGRKVECFLRRHAASWKLTCSERLSGECACDNPHPEHCPNCGVNGHAWGEKDHPIIKRQLEVERRIFGKRVKLVLVRSEHFYLLTDLPKLKIITQEAAPRIASRHEIAHMFIQRAEVAYRDFVAYFGDEIFQERPMGIYLLAEERMKQDIATDYFGLPEPELYYGGDIKSIGGGYAWNGCAISAKKYRTDHDLHHQMRHLIGHLLMSCYLTAEVANDRLPRWMYSGAGHWLSRLPAKYREDANFCSGEGREVRHSGKKWNQMLLAAMGVGKLHAVQRVFDVNALGGLDLQMHVRSWSWFDVFLEEDRERFVAFIRKLRGGTNHRVALRETFGVSPEEWDKRWQDRLLGTRDSVAPTPEELDDMNPEAPGVEERESLRSETDIRTLAAKIRALKAVNDPLTAATLLSLLRTDSELVRQTIVLVLSRTSSADVKRLLRTQGLSGQSGEARAAVARIIGAIPDKEAAPALTKTARDAYWLTRAHSAYSLGQIGDPAAIAVLTDLVDDKVAKVRISAMDGLAMLGEKAARAWEPVGDNLGSARWQVRSAAAECLGALGEMKSVESLIARMEIETGRVREDIHAALKKITRDDLGRKPEYWREWWNKEKARHGGVPPRGKGPKGAPKGAQGYAEPTYYGMRVYSRGVGFAIDTSFSMAYVIEIDAKFLKRQGRKYPPEATKFDLAKFEVGATLASLDPRTLVNLYFFRSFATKMSGKMMSASPGTAEKAIRRLDAEKPSFSTGRGEQYRTNYIDVFRLILGVKQGVALSPKFGDAPDTIYFLTDGKPTVGDITQPEILLSWIEERNRFARIRLHVITFGSTEVDLEFMSALATHNGGVFVQVPAAEK